MKSKLYKIVKSYPFSPPVGTILHYDSFADWYQNANEDYIVESRIIEEHPEYFEEVKDEYRFIVYTKDRAFHNSWKVVEFRKQPEDYEIMKDSESIRFFKEKTDAYDFIMDNKPCLSLDDLFQLNHGNSDVLCMKYDKLKRLVQERL
jgi:hypothetical protein